MYNNHKMRKGGPVFQKPRSVQVIRYSGLFVPIVLIIYAILIKLNIVQTVHPVDNFGIIMFSFWWIYVCVIQILFPISSKLDTLLRFIVFHLLAGSSLLFVAGVSTPIATFWILFILSVYIHYSIRGFIFSTLALALVVAADISLWYAVDKMVVVNDLTTYFSIVIISVITLLIFRFQEVSEKELNKSKVQESLQRDRVSTIINNLADAVISTDMDGIVRVYNAASLDLLDTNVSLNGRHIDDILPLINQDNKGVSLFKELQNTKTVASRDDLDYAFDDDDKVRLNITFSPIHSSYSRSKNSDTHDGYIIIMRDITKTKNLEEERDEFISVVSHELRTPITIAEGTISNVQVMMGHPDVTTSMLKDSVDLAHEQILFLAGMVNDLSALSRAERGVGDDAEDINILELAHEMHKKYADEAKTKKIHLNLDLSPKLGKVYAGRLYLEELLQNIITNALKYTKKGSVTIALKQSDDMVTFSIKDTGIGISKSDQTKIYGKFYRSEDYRTRESSGTGLGLYIASKLAHKLGVKISLTSRLNFGSTFSFTMPISKNK